MKWSGKISRALATVATFRAVGTPDAKAHEKNPRLARDGKRRCSLNLDNLAKEGMLFTVCYAQASCTAGRANFITGELPIRTGVTMVGQAGAKIGAIFQFVQVPILPLRVRPAGNGQGNPNLPGIFADAARRELNLDAIKAEMAKWMAEAEAAAKGPSN